MKNQWGFDGDAYDRWLHNQVEEHMREDDVDPEDDKECDENDPEDAHVLT